MKISFFCVKWNLFLPLSFIIIETIFIWLFQVIKQINLSDYIWYIETLCYILHQIELGCISKSHISNIHFHENRLAFKIMLKYANWIQDLTKMQIIIFEILFLTQRKKLSFFTGFNGSSFFSYFTRIICFDANMFAVQSTYLDLIQMNLHNRLKHLFLRIHSFIHCIGKNWFIDKLVIIFYS